jgi:hypothetical protein
VELTTAEKAELLTLIDGWAHQVGFDGLPAGIYELRSALHGDLGRAPRRDQGIR